MRILINNEEVVCSNKLEIKEEMLTTSSVILNNCYPLSWETNKDYITNFYYPKDYSKCEIYDNNNQLIFCGVVKNTGSITLNPRHPHYTTLQILDFKTFLSEGNCLDFVIDGKTILEAIQLVIDTVEDYGVVLGNVNIANGNDMINAYSTLNKTAYDVLQFLADSSNSRWTTRLVDKDTIAVDFFDPELQTPALTLEYNKEFWYNNNIEDLEYNFGTYDYRNKQIITSNEVYGSIDYTETIITDGYNRNFNTNSHIGLIKSIQVDGVTKTFGTFDDRDMGYDFDFYYQPGDTRLDQNSENPIIASNSQIIVLYTPMLKGRQIVYNNDEVDRITTQIGRNGVISRYEDRNDVSSTDNLYKIAQAYIKYKGSAEIQLNLLTYNTQLYNVGDIVYFNAPINDLKQSYMVKKKIIETYNTNANQEMFCSYILSSSYNSETEINYFDNQRNKTKGNIGVGEYITRNIDIENNANIIFNNLNVEESTIQGDNILNCGLNSPFIQ